MKKFTLRNGQLFILESITGEERGWAGEIISYNFPNTDGFDRANTYYVTYDMETGIETSNISLEQPAPANWYNYNEKRWANIKTISNGVSAYFVWIPRYEYKIPIDAIGKADANALIDINIIPTSKAVPTVGYSIPEAFWWDKNNNEQQDMDENINGFWIAKYECSLTSDGKIQVVPGVSSYRNVNHNTYFKLFREMEVNGGSLGKNATIELKDGKIIESSKGNNIDSHMMKNTEWGAVAYLSQSKYGKGEDDIQMNINPSAIDLNDPNMYLTGGTWESNLENRLRQSTTQNIYGVFDMSACAGEYVAGLTMSDSPNLTHTYKSDNKYKNMYMEALSDRTFKTGDATFETKSWYGDNADFISLNYRWGSVLIRGYKEVNNPKTSLNGIFAFLSFWNYYGDGGAYNHISSRPSIISNIGA